MYQVHIVNPAPKRRPKMAKKKSHRKRRAKRASTTAAPARRSRRRRARFNNPMHDTSVHTNKRFKKRRRRNPGKALRRTRRRRIPGMATGIMSVVKSAAPRLVGQIAVAAAIKAVERFGGKPGGNFSTSYGEPLNWKQYLAGAAVALFGHKLLGKFVSPQAFQIGAVDYLVGKAFWTEGVARSPMAVKFLGNAPDGASYYDPDGQGWMSNGSQFYAMQGLVDAGPMDGLVDAGPLDGIADYGRSTNTDPYSR